MFQLLSGVVGWQQAKRFQKFAYQYGYSKAGVGWKLAKFIQKAVSYSKVQSN
jgi:hypothetical protein